MVETLLIGALASGIPMLATVYFLRRRLCAVAQIYAYAPLSSTGVAVDLTVLNRGHRAEHEVQIDFDPKRSYTLLASSNATVSIAQSSLQIPRMAGGQSVSVVVQVDGGDFNRANVTEFSSKEAKGRFYDSLEAVPQQPVAVAFALAIVLALLLLLPLGAFLFARSLDPEDVPKILRSSSDEKLAEAREGQKRKEDLERAESLESMKAETEALRREQERTRQRAKPIAEAGWHNADRIAASDVFGEYDPAEFPIVLSTRRDGNTVFVDVKIENKSNEWFRVRLSVDAPVDQPGDFPYWNSAREFVVLAGTTERRTLRAYLPVTFPLQELEFDASVRNRKDLLLLERTVNVDRGAS